MSTDLHTLTKSELIERLSAEQLQVAELHQRLSKKDQIIAQLQRMLFGQKRERFDRDPAQGRLPFEEDPASQQQREQQHEQTITYTRKTNRGPTTTDEFRCRIICRSRRFTSIPKAICRGWCASAPK